MPRGTSPKETQWATKVPINGPVQTKWAPFSRIGTPFLCGGDKPNARPPFWSAKRHTQICAFELVPFGLRSPKGKELFKHIWTMNYDRSPICQDATGLEMSMDRVDRPA